MWTKEQLHRTIQERMADSHLVVVSNRQPFSHMTKDGKVVCQRQPGGLVTALIPVLQAAQGTWIATGTSEEDRQVVDVHGRVMLPPENPSYALRRIFPPKEDMDAYYDGYCNQGLWPLSHLVYTRPVFNLSDWEAYQRVNRMFADAILEEVGYRQAFVWIQDFHLTLVAKYLKEAKRSNIITALFWHIPWPSPEVFTVCPQKKEIVEGLLAHDLLGFQTRYHCDSFLATVDKEVESLIDRPKSSVTRAGHETLVRAFPISVDFPSISGEALAPDVESRWHGVRDQYSLGDKKLLIGVDRIDYTKGICDRFRAVDRFLEKNPQYKGELVFFQIGQMSRMQVQRYKDLNDEIDKLVEDINRKHAMGSWIPIILARNHLSYEDILALYRKSDACLVSSLHDGMNLVAKEFVASRPDLGGVLILSQFTGAAQELKDALVINPFDQEAFAEAIAQALSMPKEEREKRMKKMRDIVEQNNIYRWAGKVLSELLKFELQEV